MQDLNHRVYDKNLNHKITKKIEKKTKIEKQKSLNIWNWYRQA